MGKVAVTNDLRSRPDRPRRWYTLSPQMEDSELTSHAPNETSICLSGGGLRAASFSLGVLQVLQERRGLLSGPRPATYLAAVSGGAYIGAAAILNCAVRARDPGIYRDGAPLARGSAEEAHILGNADYMARGRGRLAGLCALNFLSLVMLFVLG